MPTFDPGPVRADDAHAPARIQDAIPSTVWGLTTWIGAGSAFDRPGQEGLAALVAQTAAEPVLERASAVGGTAELTVERDGIGLAVRCPPTHAGDCIDAWAAVWSHPSFSDTLPRAQAHGRQHLHALANDPRARGRALLEGLVFEGHPYAHPPVGRTGTLDTFVVSHLETFWRTHWVRQNVVAGLHGSWTDAQRARVAEALEGLPATIPTDPSRFTARFRAGRELLLVAGDGPAWLHVGHAIPADTPRRTRYLAVLGLGVLTEQRPSAHLVPGWDRRHPHVGIEIGPVADVESTLAELHQAMEQLCANGLTAGQATRARTAARQQLAGLEQDGIAMASLEARHHATGSPSFEELQRWEQEATPEAISDALAAILRPDAVKAVLGTADVESVEASAVDWGFDAVWTTSSTDLFR